MKIYFFIESLGWGGAENVTVLITRQLAQNGHDVSIVSDIYSNRNFDINSQVKLIPLYQEKKDRNGLGRTIKLIRTIRRYVKEDKPDVSVAIMPAMFRLLLLATIGLKHKIIASDHTSFDRDLGWRNKFIRFFLYKYADAVTILSQADFDYLGDRLPQKVIMPNPLAFDVVKNITVKRNKKILAAGRLDVWYVKGFDLLINAWSRIAHKYPEWSLEIAGGGSGKSSQEMQHVIDELGVSKQTFLIGFQNNLDERMRDCEIFVLSSRVEGFGMVLIEAMSQGCACVSFDCGGRQREIIDNYTNGIVVDNFDIEQLGNTLDKLIEDETLRLKLASNAVDYVRKYSLSSIADKWENLLNNL